MRLLMVSGDRQVSIGRKGPFWAMQREFSRHFERVDVLCPRPDGEVTVRAIHGNVHLHPSPGGRAGMVGYIAKRGAELVREHGHALIVSHDYGWFYNGIGSARLSRASGVPYVSEIHHVPGFPVAADLRERFDRFVAKRYVRWARARAAAFRVVNSAEMPPLLESWGVPREQIAVLPSLYIDLDTFAPGAPGAPGAEPPRAEQDVLFVGRFVANKGLDRIVAALALLGERGKPASALLLGQGPLWARVEADVRARGLAQRVRFLDWVDQPADLAELYRKSRAVVCASTCEGGPRFTVEAMACGTPVASTPVGVMTELLRDGTCGALADFTAGGLADALEGVLGDEARRVELGRAARARAEGYEYHAVLRRYAEGLKAIAGRGKVSA